MKRVFLILLGVFILSTSVSAQMLVPLIINPIEEDQPFGNGYPKNSITPPTVYIEDYTLSFEANHPEYLLSIRDEDGYVVYTTMVYSTETQVVLPTTLSGDYMIELAMGELLFTGWINL